MIPLIFALVSAVAEPSPIDAAPIAAIAPAPVEAAVPAAPKPLSAADAVVAQAFGNTGTAAAPLPPAPGSSGSLAMVLAVPMALGGLALLVWAVRRNRAPAPAGHLEILQTLQLPTRRGLVVASLGPKTLLLGVTEGGITVLSTSDTQAAATTAGLDGFPSSLQQAFDAAELERKLLAVAGKERM